METVSFVETVFFLGMAEIAGNPGGGDLVHGFVQGKWVE
jgi:hypothetical protein